MRTTLKMRTFNEDWRQTEKESFKVEELEEENFAENSIETVEDSDDNPEPIDFTTWAKVIANSFKSRLLVQLEMGDCTTIAEGAFHELWEKHAQNWEGYNGTKGVRYSLKKALGISSSWTTKLN